MANPGGHPYGIGNPPTSGPAARGADRPPLPFRAERSR